MRAADAGAAILVTVAPRSRSAAVARAAGPTVEWSRTVTPASKPDAAMKLGRIRESEPAPGDDVPLHLVRPRSDRVDHRIAVGELEAPVHRRVGLAPLQRSCRAGGGEE